MAKAAKPNTLSDKEYIADLEAQIKAQDEIIAKFDGAYPDEKIIALEAKVKEQEATIAELNEVNAVLESKIEEQEILLAAKDKSAPVAKEKKKSGIPSKSFKVDGEEHVFTVPKFTNPLDNHSVITADEALTNKDLLAHLVKNDTGITKRKGS